MKKISFILISFLLLIVTRVPGLQAEDWVGDRITFPLIYSQEEGKSGFPILCLEGVSVQQLDSLRAKYTTDAAGLTKVPTEGENRIILWDEAKRISYPQASVLNGNSDSCSVLTAVSFK